MDQGHTWDPMGVPYVFVDSDEHAARLAVEWTRATHVAMDTETKPVEDVDMKASRYGPMRVLSAFAAFDDTEGIDPEGLVDASAFPPEWLPEGTVAIKVYVLDMGYVTPAVIAEAMAAVTPYCWNASFERRVFLAAGLRCASYRDLMFYQADLDLGSGPPGPKFYTGLAQAAEAHLAVKLGGKGGIQMSYRGIDEVPELSEDQKAYAAQDAVATGWLIRKLGDLVEQADLTATVELDCRAQPFISDLNYHGVPFTVEDAPEPISVPGYDRTFDGWNDFLAYRGRLKAECETKLALLTGSGQGMLDFDGNGSAYKPNFNPGSQDDLIKVLNEHCPDEVAAYTARHLEIRGNKPGKPRKLRKTDSVDKDALKLIGGELAEALNEWSKHNKVLVDCGEDFVACVYEPTGRLHSNYKASLVATGRLASESPALQNRPPEWKPFVRAPEGRAFVYADLSQAELRMMAQEAGDVKLTLAFVNREDIHTTTSSGMFHVDIAALNTCEMLDDAALRDCASQVDIAVEGKSRDAIITELHQLAKKMRAKGKILNFGIAYGLKGRSLARTLCLAGVDTTPREGDELTEMWLDTYPQIKDWMGEREAFMNDLANNPPACDWDATWRLYHWHKKVTNAKFTLRKRLGYFPDAEQISEELSPRSRVKGELTGILKREPSPAEVDEEIATRVETIRWVLSFLGPVVIAADGSPFTFESRTRGGRRRLFQVGTDAWLTSAMLLAGSSSKPRPAAVRDEFARQHNLRLSRLDDKTGQTKSLSWTVLKRIFSQKTLKARFVEYVMESMPEAADYLSQAALKDCIRSMANQFRNHKIQGGVADATLLAYALLSERLVAFPNAFGIMSVHDSITIECDLKDARAIGKLLVSTMEEALAFFTPDVPTVADLKLLYSLVEDDVIPDDVLDAAEAEAQAFAA